MALFLRCSACVQMENTQRSQSSALGVLIRTRRDRAEFVATQKVSESAECKCECKDLQQAKEIFDKTLLLLVTLRLCYLKSYLSLYF